MRLFSGKRTEQAGHEFAIAVVFSFLLHVLVALAAFFLTMMATPKTRVPPFYQVKLVGRPADLSQASPAGEAAPAAPAKEAMPKTEQSPQKAQKAAPKPKKTAPAPQKALPKKGVMSELHQKPKPAASAPSKPQIAPTEPPAGPSASEVAPAKSGGKAAGVAAGVAVGTTSQEFKFPPYLVIVRDKIEQNWNPPPSAKAMKVNVLFKILRSGRVGDTNLEKSSGNFYFDQAAMRAILLSSPFPPLPEGFYKEYEVFSVDLMDKE
jgi:TonB family protein